MNDQPFQVELFTQPHCGPCRQVEAFLQRHKVRYVRRDVTEDASALVELASRGYMATPVLHAGDEWVVGFDRKTLQRLFG
jgi:glutaredoxin